MDADQWIRVLQGIATIIGASAAAIAAGSSLKNGKTLKNGGRTSQEAVRKAMSKPPVNTISNGGNSAGPKWYKAPDFDD